jgi:hypothetical protein
MKNKMETEQRIDTTNKMKIKNRKAKVRNMWQMRESRKSWKQDLKKTGNSQKSG